jgi:hypothetical protein
VKDPGPKYHVAMAVMCRERGYRNLAESHMVMAMDCGVNCRCRGCASFRRYMERREGTDGNELGQ